MRELVIIMFTVFIFTGCSKSDGVNVDSEEPTTVVPKEDEVTFKFEQVDDVNYFGASLSFTITSGNRNIQQRGVVYSLNEQPTDKDSKQLASNVTGAGLFDVVLTQLSEGRTYYVRPFVVRSSGMVYGEQIELTTKVYPKPTVYLDSTTFSNQEKFSEYWNMFYPWGTDHNGSARMYEKQVSIESDGILKIKADRTEVWEGYSTADPWLRVFYHSGAIHAKKQITVTNDKPYWVISGDFKVPTMVGSWPAFWITGAWTWPPEIDIMEFKGDNTNWQNTVTGPNWQNTSWQTTKTVVQNAGEWHNYKLIMIKVSDTHISAELYIDGQKKATHTADFVNKPFWLIINMQMEGASGGHASGPQSAEMQARNVYVAAYDVIP